MCTAWRATLYVLLCGQRPFKDPDPALVLFAVQEGEFPRPHEVLKDVPRPLEAVCLKAMRCKPEDRYSTALDLAKDLERWLADEPVQAYPEPVHTRAARSARKCSLRRRIHLAGGQLLVRHGVVHAQRLPVRMPCVIMKCIS